MLKTAYQLGVQWALKEAGIEEGGGDATGRILGALGGGALGGIGLYRLLKGMSGGGMVDDALQVLGPLTGIGLGGAAGGAAGGAIQRALSSK